MQPIPDLVVLDTLPIIELRLKHIAIEQHEVDGNLHISKFTSQVIPIGATCLVVRVDALVTMAEDLANDLYDLATLLSEQGETLDFSVG
jgi:hypothetical protein